MRPTRFFPLLCIFIALLCAGCLDVDQTFTINPDGSGKVLVDADLNLPFITMGASSPREVEEQLRAYAGEIIEGSEGVEVWKDVECTKLRNGHVRFRGTAYFPDLSALKIKQASFGTYTTHIAGDSMTIEMAVDAKKSLGDEMTGSDDSEDDEDGSAEAPQPVPMPELPGDSTSTGDDMGLGSMLQDSSTRGSMATVARMMLEMMLKDLHFHTRMTLPGAVQEIRIFTQDTAGRVVFDFPSPEIRTMIDSLLADESFWRNQGGDGSDAARGNRLGSVLTGENQPRVTVRNTGRPLFNYKSEVATAMKKYPGLLKKFKAKKKDDGQYSML